ncbi:MAG: YkvA family protein [bacterium]
MSEQPDNPAAGDTPPDDGRLRKVLEDSHRWLQDHAPRSPTRLVGRIRLLVMVGSDYLAGEYRRLPTSTIWALMFALVYVVSPVDVIPDVVPGLGWLDDAFVVGLVIRAIRKDLRKYCREKGLDTAAFGV